MPILEHSSSIETQEKTGQVQNNFVETPSLGNEDDDGEPWNLKVLETQF